MDLILLSSHWLYRLAAAIFIDLCYMCICTWFMNMMIKSLFTYLKSHSAITITMYCANHNAKFKILHCSFIRSSYKYLVYRMIIHALHNVPGASASWFWAILSSILAFTICWTLWNVSLTIDCTRYRRLSPLFSWSLGQLHSEQLPALHSTTATLQVSSWSIIIMTLRILLCVESC